MVSKQEIVRRMCQSGILPVFRTQDAKNLIAATKAFYDAGVACVEYTMTMPNVLEMVAQATKQLPADLFLGVGTVVDGPTVDRAVAAGATFIASPGLRPEMIEACNHHGVASVVGVMTPTEVMEAVRLGADVIKVFPSAAVGPEFFADVLGPFPGLHLMSASRTAWRDMKAFIAAGAEIITFLGEGMDAAAYAAGDFAAIKDEAARRVEAVRAARQTA